MPLSPSRHQPQSQPQHHPHPLTSNSTRANPMRRPTFLFKRKRSNSVPNLAFADVSAEEAGLIFSAAERASARRRRPLSEYSPGPSIILNVEEGDSTPAVHAAGLMEAACRAPSKGTSTSLLDPWTSGTTKNRHSISSITSSDFDIDDSSSVGSLVEPISPLTAPSISPGFLQPQPGSPKRLVESQYLKAYADSMFVFTQARLSKAAPNVPMDLSLLAPHVKVDTAPLEPQDLVEGNPLQRPPLKSHFSDWSQTTFETDADSYEPLTRWSSSVHTPDWNSRAQSPEDSGLASPDSFFSEVTPRVAQSTTWTDTVSSSPTWISRATSPTRGSLQDARSLSVSRASLAPSDAQSYFANFDGHTFCAESRPERSFDFSTADNRQTPVLQASLLAKRSSIVAARPVSSSASDATPFARREPSAMDPQMVDVSVRPPSWLVRAIC